MVRVAVDSSGAIILGPSVVVDGYRRKADIRVQTHIHEDHLGRFESSKGVHDIVLHRATRDLLQLESQPDLQWRENVHALDYDEIFTSAGLTIELVDAGHVLGSAQVAVEDASGTRIGYSGDIAWPLDRVIQVDELVIDATYGSPASVRRFDQQQAEAALIQLVSDRLHKGSVVIKAHRGTLHRAATLLGNFLEYPVVVSRQVKQELDVYSQYGLAFGDMITTESHEGPHVRLLGHRQAVDRFTAHTATTINLSGFRVRKEPVQTVAEDRTYTVCLSDHADFEDTLEYVEATGAHHVVVDNSRSGNGVELALAIAERLGIPADYETVDEDSY